MKKPKTKLVEHSSIPLLLQEYGTPLHIFDLNLIRENIVRFVELFPDCKLYYSTKTNPEPAVIDIMLQENLSFDAATFEEISYLIDRGVPAGKILFTHPIKTARDITAAERLGVKYFTFDSNHELQKLLNNAPDSKYFLRIQPASNDSLYDYKSRFGADEGQIIEIMNEPKKVLDKIIGISFHTGTQSMSTKPFRDTCSACAKLIEKYSSKLTSLKYVNVGSGFPEKYAFQNIPDLKDFAVIAKELSSKLPKNIQLCAEPGRILVATSSIMIAEIIDKISRTECDWIFTNLNVYNGLIEILESNGTFKYQISGYGAHNNGKSEYTIAGNTLDPDDILATEVLLANKIHSGDKLVVHDTGAYTTTFHGGYHSLNKPFVAYIDSKFDKNVYVGNSDCAVNGVVALRDFKPGEKIFTVTGYFSNDRTRNSFQVSEYGHVEPAILGAYLNHSCDPNAGINTNKHGLLDVIARKLIKKGEEVMADYAMFEYQVGEMSTIDCLCGTSSCRHKITGYRFLPDGRKREYQNFVADYLLKN